MRPDVIPGFQSANRNKTGSYGNTRNQKNEPVDMKLEVVVIGVSKGVTSMKPGSINSLTLAIEDIESVRKDLIARVGWTGMPAT